MDAPEFDQYMFEQAAVARCKQVKSFASPTPNILEKASRTRQMVLRFAYFGAATIIQRWWSRLKVKRDLRQLTKRSESISRWVQIFIDAGAAARARRESKN